MNNGSIGSNPVAWQVAFAILGIAYGYASVMSLWITNGLIPRAASSMSVQMKKPFIWGGKIIVLLVTVALWAWLLPFLIQVHRLINGPTGFSWIWLFVTAVISFGILFRKGFEIEWK